MLGPALMSAIYIWATAAYHKRDPRFVLPVGLALGVLLLIAYNLAFVHLWDQGTWYYAFPILTTSFFFCILVGDAYSRLDARGMAKKALYLGYGVVLAFAMGREILGSAYVGRTTQYDFWKDRAAVQETLDRSEPNPKLLEIGDGIISYSLESPSIHGFGFSADKASVAALRGGRLLAHAHERGHRIIASHYISIDPQLTDSQQIRARISKNPAVVPELRAELDGFDFELLLVHEPTGIVFVRFEPRTR
jgi:hypothetical protein